MQVLVWVRASRQRGSRGRRRGDLQSSNIDGGQAEAEATHRQCESKEDQMHVKYEILQYSGTFFRYCLLHHVGQVQTCLNLVCLEVKSNQLPEAWRMTKKTRQDLEVHSHLNMENRLGGRIGSDEV